MIRCFIVNAEITEIAPRKTVKSTDMWVIDPLPELFESKPANASHALKTREKRWLVLVLEKNGLPDGKVGIAFLRKTDYARIQCNPELEKSSRVWFFGDKDRVVSHHRHTSHAKQPCKAGIGKCGVLNIERPERVSVDKVIGHPTACDAEGLEYSNQLFNATNAEKMLARIVRETQSENQLKSGGLAILSMLRGRESGQD